MKNWEFGAIFSCALGLAATGCGASTSDYDARVSELRKATDREQACQGTARQSQASLEDAQQKLAGCNLSLTRISDEQRSSPCASEEGRARYRRAVADEANREQAAATLAADKAQLTTIFQEELSSGVVWLDDRQGKLRLVFHDDALFSGNGSTVGAPGKKVLDGIARGLKSLPARRLLVAGFLDAKPGATPAKIMTDLSLSLDRAWHVLEYLSKQGLENGRFNLAGMGGFDPVASNATDEGRARNRRVELQLLEAWTPEVAPASTPTVPRLATPTAPRLATPTATQTATPPVTPPHPTAASMAGDDPGL